MQMPLTCLKISPTPAWSRRTALALASLGLCLFMLPAGASQPESGHEFDVVIYGGTSAGVAAAVQTKRMGRTVAIVGPDRHLGGLSSGGLGWTDTGDKSVIGGIAREFYHRIWQVYQQPGAWRWQDREEYGNKGQGTPASDGDQRTMWIFEPHVAEQVFEALVQENGIPVFRDQWLDRDSGVIRRQGRIEEIRMTSGDRFRGKMFIDATYEGDLMAAAGVHYHVGREGQDVYGEQWAGVQTGVLHHGHHFGDLPPISPYRVADDPASGVLPLISTDPPGEYGAGDDRIQAYCFRLCLTDEAENRVPFAKPEGYDPARYELLARVFEAGWREVFAKFDPIPNHKTDTNNHGPVSSDYIGMNYDYPEASYEQRREIVDAHRKYQAGWLYFIANDPRVPQEIQQRMRQWGLAKDEFTDNGNWPHQLYIRESRRMIGPVVMTEHELLGKRPTPEPIGMGSYTIDSHNVQRYITPDGHVQNEGDIGVSTGGPYSIAYGAIVPKKAECENLLVPVCVSSSHVAFGSIRMEPVFMILGQSAATAAVLALESDSAVQDVPYDQLSQRLKRDGQVLDHPRPEVGVAADTLPGFVVDEEQATRRGAWQPSRVNRPFVNDGYQHDGAAGDGKSTAEFQIKLPVTGRYRVALAYSPNANRATNVPVTVHHADGQETLFVNQRNTPEVDKLLQPLGTYRFSSDSPAKVVVSNDQADGHVVLDAVQWLAEQPWPEPVDTLGSLRQYFARQVQRIEKESDLHQFGDLASWQAVRQQRRDELADMLGLFPYPERGDLQATIVGTVVRDGVIVERLHFQSFPHLYVTANLYRPAQSDGPLPAILYMCGHAVQRETIDGQEISYGNKAGYQRHGAWYARHGYICLTIDTVQWGEFLGSHWGTYRDQRWDWVTRGYTPAGVETWNGIRALDYLATRPDVDMSNIGLTGRSGGGAYSWFIAALDDRPKAIVPVAGITDLRNHVIDGCVSGHCDCMYMVNYYRWDYPQVAALIAPRPLLLANSDKDTIFPLDGVLRTAAKVRHIYDLYDANDSLGLMITPGPHKDTPELQTGEFRWMDAHLKSVDQPIDEPAVERFDRRELRVFGELPADQQVRTVDEVFVDRLQAADQSLGEEVSGGTRESLSRLALSGWPSEPPPLDAECLWSRRGDGVTWELWEYQSQSSLRLRALIARVGSSEDEGRLADRQSPLVIRLVDDAGWQQARQWAEDGTVSGIPQQTTLFLAVRGVGPDAWEVPPSERTHLERRFYLLGQTLAGMRIWDVLRGIALAGQIVGKGPGELTCDDSMRNIAVFAAALSDQPVTTAASLSEDYQTTTPLLGAGRVPGLEAWLRQETAEKRE